ncbi:MAG: deoxyhypusine synthase [Thermoprotei archaeon]|nr:MAG: deoxyhypusine synthase [Thermoprotei archaeon]RLF14166.1 MAG: deoxyhypusine synthase [Thermoprotei archaeon]
MRPVEDYDVDGSTAAASLVNYMRRAGGFTARHLAEAVEVLEAMFKDDECTVFLAFPACLVATGLRGVLAGLVKRGLVDVIVTTGGTLDHDVARAHGARYLEGSFYADDSELAEKGIHRLGNVFIPRDDYGPLLERVVWRVLDELHASGVTKLTSRRLAEELGKRLSDENSILKQAASKGVPIYSPGILDSAVGTQLVLYSQVRRLELDLIQDERELLDLAFAAKKLGALILGGGISKHHVLWFSQFKGGLDYAVYVTTAQEYDGSLSGARVREAVSWSKVKPEAKQITVDGDATVILPLMLAGAYARLGL